MAIIKLNDNKNIIDNISGKQIGINGIANIVSFSINLLVSFVLTPFLIKTIGKETYSFYPIATMFVNYISIVTNALNATGSRFVTINIVKDDKTEANYYYNSVVISNCLLAGLLALPMLIFTINLSKFLDVPYESVRDIKILFALVFFATEVNIIASGFGISTFSKNRIDLRSIREIVVSLVKALLFTVMYTILPTSIIYVGIVYLISTILNIAFQVYYTRLLLPEISVSKRFVNISHVKILFSSSIWNITNSFGNYLLAGTTILIANILYGSSASGTISIVNTVPQFINGIISVLAGVFYPVITYKYAMNDKPGLLQQLEKSQIIVGAVCSSIIVCFLLVSHSFFSLWTPNEDAKELALLSFIAVIPHFVIGTMWSLTNLNVVLDKVKVPAKFTFGVGIVFIIISIISRYVLNLNYVSLLKANTFLQLLWIGLFIPIYASKNLTVPVIHFFKNPIKIILVSFICFFICSQINRLFDVSGWIILFLVAIIDFLVCICMQCFFCIGINKILAYISTIK